MKLQKTPNEWSCLAAAFAMCMDVPVQELLDSLPNGGQEVFLKQEKTKRRRGHHPQELLDLALALGFATVELEVEPEIGYSESEFVPVFKDGKSRLLVHMNLSYRSVICGRTPLENGHAVAFDPMTQKYYDPRGHILENCSITMDVVYLIIDLKNNIS